MLSVLALLPTASPSRNGVGLSAPGDTGVGAAHLAVGSVAVAATGGDAEGDPVASGAGAGIGDGDGAAVGVEAAAGEAAEFPVLPPEESEGLIDEDVAAQ